MRALSHRHRASRRTFAPARLNEAERIGGHRAQVTGRGRPGDARCLHLRARTNRIKRHRVGVCKIQSLRGDGVIVRPPESTKRSVTINIDGTDVIVPEGSTILQACRTQGIDTPTLCYLENLTPVNVCRVCVVELEGARALVPACSRRVEAGMAVQTDSARVRHSRRLVLELL